MYSPFDPMCPVEFEAFFQKKKLGWPNVQSSLLLMKIIQYCVLKIVAYGEDYLLICEVEACRIFVGRNQFLMFKKFLGEIQEITNDPSISIRVLSIEQSKFKILVLGFKGEFFEKLHQSQTICLENFKMPHFVHVYHLAK